MSETNGIIEFPSGFLWGTATAAHQIEGGNLNNDWWAFEHKEDTIVAEPSGDACDSYNRWEEDLDLVASMGLNAYRFSIEWSRIEPVDGEVSHAQLDHYARIIAGARDRGLLPVVTFHHFSSPTWFAERGGFEQDGAPERFAAFVERTTARLGDEIGIACTINEPNIVGFMGYVLGMFPPGVSGSMERYRAVSEQFVTAHRLAVEALRAGPGSFPVGLALSMAELIAHEGGEASKAEFQEEFEDVFLRGCLGDDFIGVQCYTRHDFGPDGFQAPAPGARVTPMGYEFYPEALGATVRRAASVTGLPVLVTENGTSASDDRDRVEYLDRALRSLHGAISDGVDVRGYIHWSLMDNFEWTLGYAQQFGLYEVDRVSFERRAKPSAGYFAQIARTSRLSPTPVPSTSGESA